MKKFRVIKSSNEEYLNKEFNIKTAIRENVTLPFTTKSYRCCMLDGIYVKLVMNRKEDNKIKGILI